MRASLSDYIEGVVPVEVRVKYISLTVFIFDVIDNYTVELEHAIKDNGFYSGKVKYHLNRILENSKQYNNTKLKLIKDDYRQYLLDQVDDMQEMMRNDFKILVLSMKSLLDKLCDDGTRTKIMAIASMCRLLAAYYHLKEEDYANIVNDAIGEDLLLKKYKFRDSRIANIGRHSDEIINIISRDIVADLGDSEDIKKAWDILDKKISDVQLDLNYDPS